MGKFIVRTRTLELELQEKVLGMWWLPESDMLTFFIWPELLQRLATHTKRRVLSIVMSIFDPLGILEFFNIRAKIILQNIWRPGVGWDNAIKEPDENEWMAWKALLKKLGDLRIPRYMSCASSVKKAQLHVFVDASLDAYAAVAYLRVELGREIRCSLVASENRVAPLKPISVPRMELMAAILGLRLAKFLDSELSTNIEKRIFWTDAKDVLYWIKSDARKYPQFVALRIREILEGSEIEDWRWVPSEQNVADEGTKWTKKCEINSSAIWFTGPEFLMQGESQWPLRAGVGISSECELMYHDEETQKNPSPINTIMPDPLRFSKLKRLRAAQRHVLDFLRCIHKNPRRPELVRLFKLERYAEMDTIFIRSCQEEAFPNEMRCLKKGDCVTNRKSTIFKLSPYLDSSGVLQMQGRIEAIENVEVNVKHPIILPRGHRVTYLIVEYYHRKYHHLHGEIVVNEIRQHYWIPGLRALVKDTAKICSACCIRRAQPLPPIMGNLPKERLSPFTLPFTFTGVDYFGPMEIAVGRRREKRWGVLFTCPTVRAVHLEIVPSLSTDSFLLALKLFTARRGVPVKMLSDNGTNFRGASRVLTKEIERISTSEVECKYPEMSFAFIPPGSPHMGGAWERMVRSTKSILAEILANAGLREEVLRAALAYAEHTLNSRPLTYIPLESENSEALTPNHFLVGNSSGLRERGTIECTGLGLAKNFQIAGQVANRFWKRWIREYLPTLTRRTKLFQPNPKPIAVNDVVIVVDETSKRNTWPKVIVVDVHCGKDGQKRSAVVRTTEGFVTRPAVKLAKLDIDRTGNTRRSHAEELRGGECCEAGESGATSR